MARKKNPNLGNYTGTQYRGGRNKGKKNLTRLDDGSYVNQYGVVFSQDEKKRLESSVNTANRKRKKMIERTDSLPILFGGQPTGQTQRDLRTMGKPSDFLITQKTKSLQRFRTKEDYYTYMEALQRVNSRDYVERRVDLYRNNIIQAGISSGVINNSRKGRIIEQTLRSLSPEEFARLAIQEQIFDFTFWDSDADPLADEKRDRAYDALLPIITRQNAELQLRNQPTTRNRRR